MNPFFFIVTIVAGFIKNGHSTAPAVNFTQYMNEAKILTWAKSDNKRVQQITRYIQLFHHKLTPGDPGARKLPKNCESDPSFTNLRFWPSAKAGCSDKQYTALVDLLTQYDAQQVADKDKIIGGLRINIAYLKKLNTNLKDEIAGLNQFIAGELEDMIKRYVRYVNRSDSALDAHSARLTAHTADLERLLGLVQHGNGASGLLHDIQNAQTEAEHLLAEAETASGKTLEALAQKVKDLQSIINIATEVFTSYNKEIDVLTQAMGAPAK